MRTILVVDDETNLRHTLAYALRQEGYEAVTAEDGQAALEAFNASAPELVVLDVMLPKIDGLEGCRRIRPHSHLPTLLPTTRDSPTPRLVGLATATTSARPMPAGLGEDAEHPRGLETVRGVGSRLREHPKA